MNNDEIGKSEVTQRISRDTLNGMETKTIPVICPWCNSIFKMSKWEVDTHKKTGVTHGICPECLEKTLKDAHNPRESQHHLFDVHDKIVPPLDTEVKNTEGIQKSEVAKQGAADRFWKFFKFKT